MTGTIKRIKRTERYGFIRDAKGTEYFFHESALKNSKLEELSEGQDVSFEEVETPKGWRAEDVYV